MVIVNMVFCGCCEKLWASEFFGSVGLVCAVQSASTAAIGIVLDDLCCSCSLAPFFVLRVGKSKEQKVGRRQALFPNSKIDLAFENF